MAAHNCSRLIYTGAIPEGDADISGIGVILAFIISAYITFFPVFVAYISGFVDDGLLSPIDRRIFRIRPKNVSEHHKTYQVIRKAVLALGDQQIVTGVAIMSAGFQGLRAGNISVYHFQIVLYLAWMSSSVHLSALTLLGSWLQRHKGLAAWRLSGMFVLLVLLLIGFIPTLSNDWGLIWWPTMLPGHTGLAIPAICFWARFWGDHVNSDAVLSFIILLASYAWKIGGMFSGTKDKYNRRIRHPLEHLFVSPLRWGARKYVERNTLPRLWTFRMLLCVLLPALVVMEVASSFAASLWLSALGLVFGTIEVIIPRNQMLVFTSAQEDKWGFGQLVPLVLLVQPLGAVSESLWTVEGDAASLIDSVRLSPSATRTHSVNESGRRESEASPKSLLSLMASWGKNTSRDVERDEMLSLLVESRLYSCQVWLLQLCMLGLWVYIFTLDALYIGISRSTNWVQVASIVGAYYSVAVAMTLLFLPWSRLGRDCRNFSDTRQASGRTGRGK